MNEYSTEVLSTAKALQMLNDLILGLLERERKLVDIVQDLTDEINNLKLEPKSVVHNHYHYEGPFKYPDNPVYPPYPGYPTYSSPYIWC